MDFIRAELFRKKLERAADVVFSFYPPLPWPNFVEKNSDEVLRS